MRSLAVLVQRHSRRRLRVVLHLLKIQRLRCQRTTGRKNLDGIRARFREPNVGQNKVGERAPMRRDGYAAFDLDEHFTVWPAELYLAGRALS